MRVISPSPWAAGIIYVKSRKISRSGKQVELFPDNILVELVSCILFEERGRAVSTWFVGADTCVKL